MSWVIQTLAIESNKAELSDEQALSMRLSNDKMELSNYQSRERALASSAYNSENDLIDAQFEDVTDITGTYDATTVARLQEKMNLQNEASTEYEMATQKIDDEVSRKEAIIDLEIEQSEVRIKALEADIEGLEKSRDENIKNEIYDFGN